LMLGLFGVTAALVSYAPPIDAATGPFAASASIGPAELELTVEPAKVGLNTIHLYLINATTGSQFTATKELTATAKLPAKGSAHWSSSRFSPARAITCSIRPFSARGDLGNRNRRPSLRIRTVQPGREGAGRVIEAGMPVLKPIQENVRR